MERHLCNLSYSLILCVCPYLLTLFPTPKIMSHSRVVIYLVRFTSFRTYFYTRIKPVNNLHEFPTYFYLYILLYYANMKSYVFIVGVLLLIVTMTLNVTAHDDDSDIMIIDMPPQPTQR